MRQEQAVAAQERSEKNLRGPFLTLQQLAERSNESLAVWRKRIFFRQIAFTKFGRNVRVAEEDFQRFAKERTVPISDGRSSR